MSEPTHRYACTKCGFEMKMEPKKGSLDVRYILGVYCRQCDKKRDWFIVPDKTEPVGERWSDAKQPKAPTLGTRQQAVLAMLSDGEWHPGWHLTQPGVGGSEGLRRLRELRELGHIVEMKKSDGATRLYRLETH